MNKRCDKCDSESLIVIEETNNYITYHCTKCDNRFQIIKWK